MDNKIFDSAESFHAELKRMGEAQPVKDAVNDASSESGIVEPLKNAQEFDASLGVEQGSKELADPADDKQTQQQLHSESEATGEEGEDAVETKSHMIPKSRLNKELEKRKSLEQELQATREAQIRAETQLQLLAQLQQEATKPRQEQVAQPQLNPLDPESFDYQTKAINAMNQRLQKSEERNEQLYMQQTVQMQEQLFRQQHPDFEQALEHVKQVQINVNKMTSGNQAQAEQEAANYLRNVLTQSVKSGKNAAEVIYNMAQNFGYKNGSTKRSAPPPQTTNIDAITRNTDKAASISSVGANMAINTIPDDMKAIVDKNGRYNKDDFHKMLKAVGNKTYVG